MRTHLPTISVALVTGVALLACGSGPVPSVRSSVSRESVPNNHDATMLHGAYTAPPDRALLPIAFRATAPDPGGAAGQVRSDIDRVANALTDNPACKLQVQDYAPPVALSGDWSTSTEWRAQAWATLDVDLTGLNDAVARMDRLDECRARVLPHVAVEEASSKTNPVAHGVSMGGHTLVIDAPEAHLSALIDRRSATLTAVTAAGTAPQLHPEDYRCVPTGVVQVGVSSFAGVVLTLGLDCRVISATEPAKG
jgi:hypothetical protein